MFWALNSWQPCSRNPLNEWVFSEVWLPFFSPLDAGFTSWLGFFAVSLDSSFFTSFKRKWTSVTFWTTLGVFFYHFGFGLMGTLDPLWWPFVIVIVCDALSNNLTTIQLSWWRVEVHSSYPNHPSESLQDWRVEELFYKCYSLQRWFPSEGVWLRRQLVDFCHPFQTEERIWLVLV